MKVETASFLGRAELVDVKVDCKSVYTGSIPVLASNIFNGLDVFANRETDQPNARVINRVFHAFACGSCRDAVPAGRGQVLARVPIAITPGLTGTWGLNRPALSGQRGLAEPPPRQSVVFAKSNT
ncbi:MAG: hypothetical protein AAGL66_20335, partial [Pseudomonadota bacterium]